ncbi:rod shape-determining protein MreD [Amedibacillus sp. YH-ame10]
MTHVIFVLLCFLVDEILMILFPNSFLINDLLFISNIGFCAIMLTIRKFDWINTCLFAFGFGMFYDVVFANTFLVYAFIFTIVACCLRFWSKHMTDTVIESLILCIVTIFAKDFLVYLFMNLQRTTDISFMVWAEKYELLSLLTNAILSMIIVFLIRIKNDYLKMKAIQVRKGEKIEWFRLKSKG